MRIFVLCTGRCGSRSFARACEHMTNFTVGHETRRTKMGADRFAYPNYHIEVDNRLAWMLGRLARAHPDARYVHFRRDPEAVAHSFAGRPPQDWSLAHTYAMGVLTLGQAGMDECRDMVDTITANIQLLPRLWRFADRMIDVWLERPETFRAFWQWAKAEGDLDEAVASFAEPWSR